VVIVPDRELVMVHLGKTPSGGTAELRARLRDMIRLF
jgi:hypothetical protein